MIRATGVIKRFGRVAAVDGLDLRVDEGESVALWGSNGAGKTTLIRCLLGVLGHRGRITVNGLDTRRRGKLVRRLIGYVPQELSYHEDMRLGDAMGFFARLRGVGAASVRERLREVGLQGHERKRVRDLSGGMKQRLALGVAMLADPPLIVLDEPTSNLDAGGRSDVVESLVRLRRRHKTIVFASHRPDEVLALGDRVVVIEAGRIVRDCAPATLWSTAAGVRTIRLVVDRGFEPAAAALLREAGHAVHLNGHGLCVSVSGDRKAEPIALLSRGNVPVHDFEIVDPCPSPEGTP